MTGVLGKLKEAKTAPATNGKPAGGLAAIMAAKQADPFASERAAIQRQIDEYAERYEQTAKEEGEAFAKVDKLELKGRKDTKVYEALHHAWLLACRKNDQAYAALHNALARHRNVDVITQFKKGGKSSQPKQNSRQESTTPKQAKSSSSSPEVAATPSPNPWSSRFKKDATTTSKAPATGRASRTRKRTRPTT